MQAGDGTITVPDAHLLFTAEFSRVGDDLLLTGGDDTIQIINDYFTLDPPPPLFSPDGAMMSPELVAMLVGPRAPGLQYAQAGGAPAAEAIGEVETLTGNAQVIRAGAAVDLAVGDPVFQGDVVQTGPGSTLGITFIDETVFSLSGGSRMVLNSMVYDAGGSANSMFFDLVQGTFVFITGKVAPTGDMRIETPVATIGVRGTVPIAKISSIDGSTLYSIGEDPTGGVGSYQLFDKITGAPITIISELRRLVRVQSAGGSLFESFKTPGEQAIDQSLVSRAQEIYGRAQQRLGEEQRGEIEGGEFEQATDQANPANDPFSEPPLETAAPPVTGAQTSGGLGVDEPEFGEEPRIDTNVSSSSSQITETTSPQTPTPRQGPGGPEDPRGGLNNPPIAIADTAATDESAPVVITVLGNDSDPEGNVLSIVSVTQGSNGSVAINPDGTLTYTPAPGFSGTDSFAYTISDGVGGFATTTVNVDVAGSNGPPVAAGDEGATPEDTSITFAVLENDSDPDGDTLSVSAVTQGANGSVSFNPNGTVTYTPNLDFSGNDSFTYTVSDGQGESDTATVNVTVNPVNDPPVLGNNSLTIGSGDTVVLDNSDLSATDVDNDDAALQFTISGLQGGQFELVQSPGVGITSFTQAQITNGEVQFVEGGGDAAPSYSVTVSDGTASDSGSATIIISNGNDAPVLTDDGPSLAPGDLLTDLENDGDIIGLAEGSQFAEPDTGASGTGGNSAPAPSTGQILSFVETTAPGSPDTDDFTTVM